MDTAECALCERVLALEGALFFEVTIMKINKDRYDVPYDEYFERESDRGSREAIVPYDEELIAKKEKNGRAAFVILCAVALVILLIAALCLGRGVISGNRQKTGESGSSETEAQSEEWRGAFESREISDGCMAVCVSIRLGAVGEYGAPGVSGFVVSPDGWIVSSDRLLRSTQKGRLYARFYDGSEYAIENVVRFSDSGLSLMKIDADALKVASLGSAKTLSLGEEIVAISSAGAPEHDFALYSGIVSSIEQNVWLEGDSTRRSGLLRTDILFDGTAMGSPVFDKGGSVLGIALYENERFILPIDQIREKIDTLQ